MPAWPPEWLKHIALAVDELLQAGQWVRARFQRMFIKAEESGKRESKGLSGGGRRLVEYMQNQGRSGGTGSGVLQVKALTFPAWLEDVAIAVDELLGCDPNVRGRFHKMLHQFSEQWRRETHGVSLRPLTHAIQPVRAMTLPEKYAGLAAIHAVVSHKGAKPIAPWHSGKRATMGWTMRLPPGGKSRRAWERCKAAIPYTELKLTVRDYTDADRPRIERMLADVKRDIRSQEWAVSGTQEALASRKSHVEVREADASNDGHEALSKVPTSLNGRTWTQRSDAGGKLKSEGKRDIVMQYLDECGGWDGTLRGLSEALKNKKGLTVSPPSLSRYLKGTKHERNGNPHRAAKGKGQREPVSDEKGPADSSNLDAWTMPDDAEDSIS